MSFIAKNIAKWTQKEIKDLFDKAECVYKSKELTILSAPLLHKHDTHGRILLITPRKIGNAPKRNKLRRRLKSIFYENELFNHNKNFIFIAKKGSAQLSFSQLKEIVCSLI